MKKFFLLGMMVCLTMVANAQRSMEWYSYWGSNIAGSQIDPQRMVVDNDGNIYVAANYGGDKVAVESTTLISNSAADKGDAVIVKMSPSKVVQWTYKVVNVGSASIADIALDSQGNIVAVGAFNNKINAVNGAMALDDSNMGEAAIYVLKLNAAGQALKAWQIPAVGAKANSVVIDKNDNIIIAGLLDGDATFVPGGEPEGDFNNTAQLFIAKYDANGNHLWHQFRNDEGNSVYGKAYLAVDENENIYVASSINGSTTILTNTISTTVSNAFIVCCNANGNAQWFHMIDGEESDVAGAIAYSPIGQVIIAVNHHSGDLRIDDMSDEFNNGYAFSAAYEHAAFFSFDVNGNFKWFYDWGYSNGDSGSDAPCYSLRCTDEGVLYATGMMTGRYGGSRLPSETRTLPAGKNSGVETIDNQWLQHNTNGGHDCYMLTLTRSGKLANAIRPGGPQYEDGMDVALSPDKKSLYLLMQINVRDNVPYTCPDNIFDSWTDLDKYNRKGNYTVLNVLCPENNGSSTNYTKAYKANFASSMLVKYAMPEINPNELPHFTVNEVYSQEMSILNPQGQVSFTALEKYADVWFENNIVSGQFANNNARHIGILAVDSIALPGDITYYEYDDGNTEAGHGNHYSIRSNPRNLRYFALTEGENEEGIEAILDDKTNRKAGRKVVMDGVLYIERNGRIYNAQGAQVK